MLARIENEEELVRLNEDVEDTDNFEQNMDELMKQVDDIHEERLRHTGDQDELGQKKSTVEQSTSYFSKESADVHITEPVRKKSNMDERTKARFSTSFDD